MDSCTLLYRYKENIPILDSNRYVTFYKTNQNQTLISDSVTSMDNGTYTCKVSNGTHEIQRKIKLIVLRKYVLTLFILERHCMSVINSTTVFQTGVINIVDWYIFICLLEQFPPQTV